MQECPSCGIRNEDTRRQCFRCSAQLPPIAAAAPQDQPPGFTPVGHAAPPPPAWYNQPLPSGTAPPVHYLPGNAVDEEFLSKFSWGPGCGFYFLSRAMLWFWLGAAVLRIADRVLESMIDSTDKNDVGAILVLSLMGLLVVAAVFGLLYFAGRVARRRRWEMLKWRDFEQFRADEQQWHTLGVIGWVLTVLAIIGGFFIGMGEA
jgi:hypothetical protein